MKSFSILLLLALGSLAQPSPGHRVYVLPMGGGLDQYLADWLTRDKVMQVVTDPKAADLVMTDRLGEAFEQKLAQIRPEDVKKDEKKDDKKDGAGGTIRSTFRSSTIRGTLFLVDLTSRQVVWSDHEKPRAGSDASLNREAERVAKKLQETFGK